MTYRFLPGRESIELRSDRRFWRRRTLLIYVLVFTNVALNIKQSIDGWNVTNSLGLAVMVLLLALGSATLCAEGRYANNYAVRPTRSVRPSEASPCL